MCLKLILLVFSLYFVNLTFGLFGGHTKTIDGYRESSSRTERTFVLNAENDELSNHDRQRHKRAITDTKNQTIYTKINKLNDTHKQLMVHWVGEGSNVIICLARDPASIVPGVQQQNPSAVYISYDYGDTYVEKTELFKLGNDTYATLEKFHVHPKFNSHFVFTDIKNKLLFVTKNHGKDIKKIQLTFTPSEVSFHELMPSTIVALDKENTSMLYVSYNFGETWELAQEFVKSFHWQKVSDNYHLVVQRLEPSDVSLIIYSDSLFATRTSHIYAAGVKDFFMKGDYLFTTKLSSKGNLELYVSYKFGKQLPCIFDSELTHKSYYIVDVTGNRAFVAISHSETVSHLYVSENLVGVDGKVRFTLSLEDVLCYFPNTTWHGTWLYHASQEAFADVYKVEGISGIYIASRVISKPDLSFGPQHLGSVITYDHGRSWHLIEAPTWDNEGQHLNCQNIPNCSLHLSQKFSQLYPDSRSVSIMSSKSGIIVATGVIGKSLKGHYGVYISSDAGQTWRQVLKELYFFNMGDHGGLLTAVKYYRSKGETRHILYSTDEGETWQNTEFHNEDLRLYGLMTEPGENTTVFTMFGSLPKKHEWIIVKLDLIKAFKYNCTKDDYKFWSPSQSEGSRSYVPCVMGQTLTFQRRMAHANCYNGKDYEAPQSMQPCGCDYIDFECDFGFVPTNTKPGLPGHCVRNASILVDLYKVPDSCKPGDFYNRTKGYRKVAGDVCVGGFESHYLPDLVPCPFKEIQDFLLFAQRERISRYNLKTNTLEEVPIKNLKNVIAVDFDMKNNCVYWADIALDIIGRQCLTNGSEPDILVSSDLASIEGMAFDWISNTLYFVDGMRAKIELIRTDINHSGHMRRVILQQPILRKPRGIALTPIHGYLFWTDWSSDNPSVNRADLDGGNFKQLFGKTTVEWPNGITIDYIANRIYWVDAKRDYIASSNFQGGDFRMIISGKIVVSHPFAIAVFKNNMYWDDWKNNAIFAADKDSYHDKSGVQNLLNNLHGLMDIKVFAHGIQIGTNNCSTADCPYICVGKPNDHACLCPQEMEMKNGKCMCPGNVEGYANMTCPKVGNTCAPNQFLCNNGFCIFNKWRCDGENDCGDNSDELNCMQTCPANYFACPDGKCIPHYWTCDYDQDCADGSDELNCHHHNCTDTQFKCKNGRCISNQWKCDGENDCRDGSDEQNCAPVEPSSCKESEFKCGGGAITCIPSTWRCDGENDCRDRSDEVNCVNNTCLDVQFSCGPPTNRCIYNTWVCDGDADCPDGRDEKNCTSIKPVPERPDQFAPMNGTCHDWMFKCSNNRCIPYWWKCDEADDCGDGSDELGCPSISTTTRATTTYKPPTTCENNQYQCISGQCIFASWVCDGAEDCPTGEDESFCEGAHNCSANQFRCRIDGNCISQILVCDHKWDCPDGTDEMMCNHDLPNQPATPSCSSGYFPCDGNTCHPLSSLCDNKLDCKDGYDEMNCSKTSRVYQVLQMGVDERSVNETSILLYWWIPTPNDIKLEFMPSITVAGQSAWENKTWTGNAEFNFDNLQPFTKYNMTVYVRIENTKPIFPPAKYFVAYTGEGIPTEPWNVKAKQKNGSHVLISWTKPVNPNGIINNYQICWYPPLPPIKLKLNGNETSHLLAADFQPNVTYSFYVIAHNKKYESKRSEVATMTFDGDSSLDVVKNLRVTSKSNTSVSLSWQYSTKVDGFTVEIEVAYPYPNIPSKVVSTQNATIDYLAPGEHYAFKVSAFKKHFTGPKTGVFASTSGQSLPQIQSLTANLDKDSGTTVNLRWDKPKDSRKVAWLYGVYYGIDQDTLLEKPRLETTNLSAKVDVLDACEIYSFSVGIIGPHGYGPLTQNIKNVNTFMNKKAPPKRLTVGPEGDNPLTMKVSWEPSCPGQDPKSISYIISIYEKTLGNKFNIMVSNVTNFSHPIQVAYGGVYVISIATTEPGAVYSNSEVYHAPPILPPYEVNVQIKNNGSYIVYWQEREIPSIKYQYEVLVSEGKSLNETTALKFLVNKPPFIYTNTSSDVYTFAVRIKSIKGYSSLISERISMINSTPTAAFSGSSVTVILVVGVVLLLICSAALTVFVIKHRKLQNSFTRFANSHYDSRSGAATFDDHGLEEDDSPQITGFSDDEPLVIA